MQCQYVKSLHLNSNVTPRRGQTPRTDKIAANKAACIPEPTPPDTTSSTKNTHTRKLNQLSPYHHVVASTSPVVTPTNSVVVSASSVVSSPTEFRQFLTMSSRTSKK
ncbi:hypothetical protein BGZ58_004234 [Dissophora ornata]|nr:hypothetical protein BGZ58_004234 [Dissophora ornata]